MEMNMATPNDYGMMWMSPSQMLLSQGQTETQQVPSEMLQMDPATAHLENPYYPLALPPSYEGLGDQTLKMDGFMMMDDFESDFCEEPPKFSSTATQTSSNNPRKIKPIKHPGLKLQTPIAYKCDTDPNVIPIQKDGMAICENCGAIGVKHSFYTRHRNYCSLACARGSLFTDMKDDSNLDEEENQSQLENVNFKFPNGIHIEDDELITREALPLSLGTPKLENIPDYPTSTTISKFPFPKLELPVDEPLPPIPSRKTKQELAGSYKWDAQLSEPGFIAVPVSCFKHAPMADCWDNITVGMKVEVENRDCEDFSEAFPDSFWVATVLRVAGYKALLRYEGFGQNNIKDFWVNLCCNIIHPVGWCAIRGKPLIPPKTIENKYKDWKDFLVKRLTGARTLPSNFYTKVQDSLKSRFRVGLNVEVVDKNRISQVCVATVKRIVGKRLHVEYFNAENDDNGFWCHEDSPLIHPVGWATRVGHTIDAPFDYIKRCESGLIEKDDATEELFTAAQQTVIVNSRDSIIGKFQEGMKLEAVDPLNLSSICVATVMKVLKDGYLMIRIDSYPPDETGSDWFCYHSSSPHIFPPGFCHKNSVPLIPPKDYNKNEFRWDTYVRETSAKLAPTYLFDKPIPPHGFVVGMRLEAADLMDPRLVCVGTVSRVVGRLLKIHFDGWEEEYDQWLDCESPDVYPVGWCNLVSHKLEGPRCLPTGKNGAPCLAKKRQRKRVRTKQKSLTPSKKFCAAVTDENEDVRKIPSHKHLEIKQEVGLNHRDGSTLSVAVNSCLPDKRREALCTREPVTGREPSGPDQSLPVSAAPHTSAEVKRESATNCCKSKYIPRLIDNSASAASVGNGILNPASWDIFDVQKFLKINDCSAYAQNFLREGTDGKLLLQLTKDQIMNVIGFKIGPTLKIYDLIQQLKVKANKANFKKII